MMVDEPHPPPLSQDSSHFPLDPVTGDVLFKLETARRDALRERGNCMTGCQELDEQVLLGGFERGSVVGISAEEEETGLLIGLQTIAHLLAHSLGSTGSTPPRAMIITTLSVSTLLPMLRDVLKAQISVLQPGVKDMNARLKACLERIAISRVFDINGLWEVLGELDLPAQAQAFEQAFSPQKRRDEEQLPDKTASPRVVPPSVNETEIMDSEDEGGLSSPESSREIPAKPSSPEQNTKHTARQTDDVRPTSSEPDIILITNMSTLLTTLFTHREKTTAHTTLQLMASHMRYLTRSPEHGGPLFLILNSTTTSAAQGDSTPTTTTNPDATLHSPSDPPPLHPPHPRPGSATSKPLDPTLRSIFNPPPQSYGYDAPPTRRNKPSFGLVFTQLLDLHLLCTRVPKTRADAEALFAPPPESSATSLMHVEEHAVPSAAAAKKQQVEYATVVEVLLDEVGAWEIGGQGRRRSREQRWGAVGVRREIGMVSVVDAFEAPAKQHVGEIKLAAGFGGRIDR